MNNTKVVLNGAKLDYACDLMRALAHPLRLKILEFIDSNDKINVNVIYNSLGIEQSVTSQHLKIMKLAGVLNCTKNGKYMHYSINYDVVQRAQTAVASYMSKQVA